MGKRRSFIWPGLIAILLALLAGSAAGPGAVAEAAPAALAAGYTFTGHVYEGEPYETGASLEGITVALWGDGDEWPESGIRTLLTTAVTNEAGAFTLNWEPPRGTVPYAFFHIIEEDPRGYRSTGAQAVEPGYVKNYNCVSFPTASVDAGITYGGTNFWDTPDREASADLAVSTSIVSGLPATPGASLQYNILVWQNGPSVAANVVVTDVLPSGLTYDAGYSGCTEVEPNVLRCELGDLPTFPPGTIIWLQATVDQDACGTLSNQVEVTSDTPDPDLSDNTGSVDADAGVCTQPPISVTKTLLSPAVATVGDTVRFRITALNPGTAPVSGFDLEDYFSGQELEFVSASPEPAQILDYGTDRVLRWEYLSLPAGGSQVIEVEFTAIDPGVTTQNCAYYVRRVEGGDITGILGPSSCVSVQVNPLPGKHFSVRKAFTSPANHLASLGDWLTFETECRVTGTYSATEIQLYDHIDPASVSSFFPLQFGWMWPFETGDWAKLSAAFQSLSTASPAVNTAEWTVTWPDGTQETQTAQDYVYITDGTVGQGLFLSKRLTDPVSGAVVSDTLTYQLTITNVTGSVLDPLVLTDIFPSACLSYTAASLPPSQVAAGTLNWDNVGPLGPGESRSIDVQFHAEGVCPAALNCATATYATPGGPPLVGADCAATAIGGPQPRLIVHKTRISPAQVTMGDWVEWELGLENAGDADLLVVPLDDTFPPAFFDFVGASIEPNDVDEDTGWLHWDNVSALGGGEAMTFTLTLQAKKAGFDLANCAESVYTVGSSTLNPHDCATVAVVAGEPAIQVEKVRVEPLPEHPLSLGSTAVFSVTVRNVGSSDLANLAISDLYDPGCLAYVNAPGMNTQVLAPGHLLWDIPSLSMGDALSWEVVFQATEACAATLNCAVADAEGPEGAPVHDEMCVEFPIEPAEPGVSVRKIIVEPLELPGVGDVVHFAVIVQNIGNTPLTGVPLQDIFDADCLEYVSAMPAPDFLSPASGLLHWNNLGPLGPGETRVVRLFLRVRFTCRPSVNCAVSTAEDVNGLEVTGDTCIDVFAGEERRLYLPLVLRG